MSLALIEKVTSNVKAFEAKVNEIAGKLAVPADWLMFPMFFESGLNAQAVNKTTGATGLIQFMPDTAKQLGTSMEDLKKMSNVQQLDYVYKYFSQFKGKIKSPLDAYLAVFFPKALGQGKDYVLQTDSLKADTIAKQNPVFDPNKTGQITVANIEKVLASRVPDSLKKFFTSTAVLSTGAVIGIAVVLYFIFK
jgi:hypothetical protein